MGFSTLAESYLDTNTPQTPRNIFLVREQARWTYAEVAKELGIDPEQFKNAEHGFRQLPDSVWREFLDRAGRRAFDHDPE
ncbi:hypothetical protein SAMN05216420_101373 [Nitrosospira sp. Nl5]|uniref:helix-turn-helix domain-containing protein n=1 Tax=Nitrosospira sp. Nl5 TaxID=200120 RepID=UPI0008905F31|nr:helix-turn-helix transcriptional regulator [Nitrosospira sp. Nl5]SCX93287.1 hypothetical protein SAMN05216420_101373 [Nitrosospira sp. Nl5]